MVGDKYLIIYFIYFFIRVHKVSSRYALIVAAWEHSPNAFHELRMRGKKLHFQQCLATLGDSITKVFWLWKKNCQVLDT